MVHISAYFLRDSGLFLSHCDLKILTLTCFESIIIEEDVPPSIDDRFLKAGVSLKRPTAYMTWYKI